MSAPSTPSSSSSTKKLEEINDYGLVKRNLRLNIRELEIGKSYPILRMIKIDHLRWPSVLVELEEGSVYLPKRMAEKISQKDIDDMMCSQLALIYRGLKDVGKPTDATLVEIVNCPC
jgi:hypothetical protein